MIEPPATSPTIPAPQSPAPTADVLSAQVTSPTTEPDPPLADATHSVDDPSKAEGALSLATASEGPVFANAAIGGTIATAGPLTSIHTSVHLNCSVNYIGDRAGAFDGDNACATLVAVSGTLYGPASIPGGGNASPRTAWTPVSQTSTGSGSPVNPYKVVTVVTGGPLRLTQTDTYVTGDDLYRTTVRIQNDGVSQVDYVLYRAGDCYLQDSDFGLGEIRGSRFTEDGSRQVACVWDSPGPLRVIRWVPETNGAKVMEDSSPKVWARVGSQRPFADSCDCKAYLDNGAGLSWQGSVRAGGSASYSHQTVFGGRAALGTFGGRWRYTDSNVRVTWSYAGDQRYLGNVVQAGTNWNDTGTKVRVVPWQSPTRW